MKQTYEEIEETYIKTLKGRAALKRLLKDMAKKQKANCIIASPMNRRLKSSITLKLLSATPLTASPIARGENIGIVGHTGAGKTTLSNLIMKFYTPQTGEILVRVIKL